MDKYEQASQILISKAEPHEVADVKIVVEVIADVCRGIEQMGADIDRIATALEKLAEK